MNLDNDLRYLKNKNAKEKAKLNKFKSEDLSLFKANKFRSENAVTLTALVITIIVMIILAAVSVLGVFGDNGIFKSAITAKEDTEMAAYQEELKSIEVQTRTQELKAGSDFVYLKSFESNVNNNIMFKEARNIELRSNDTVLKIETKEGYIFYITDDELEGVIVGGVSGEIEDVKDLVVGQNVTFVCDDSVWTQGPKYVTINLQNVETTHQLQYSLNGKNWISCESGVQVKMEATGNVYARLHNGVIGGGVASTTVSKIDTLKPNPFTPTIYTTADSITINANTTDAAATSKSGSSGIASYQYSKDGGSSWETDSNEHTFNDLSTGETYTIVVRVTDNAGNYYDTTPIKKATVPLPELSDGSDGKVSNLIISCEPNSFTNKNVKVSVSTTENLSAYGFKLEYSIDGTKYSEYKETFEVEKNGKVWVAVSNGNGKYGTSFVKNIDWIDKLEPENIIVSIKDKTSSTIKVEVTAQDATATSEYASSGIKAYQYSNDGGNTWTEETSASTYEFKNLTQNREYEIKVRAIDKAGNKADSEIVSGPETTTNKVTDITEETKDPVTGEVIGGNVKFTYKPATWTNKDVVVKVDVTVNHTGYSIQYNTGNPYNENEWKAYTTAGVTFKQNGTIYIRLYDGTNGSENYATGNITNIDKVAPEEFSVAEDESGRTTSTIKVTSSGTEDLGGSGIKGYYYSYSANNGSTWIKSNKELVQETTYTFTGLLENTQYKIKMTAVDNAGNEKDAIISTPIKTKVTPTLTPGEDDGNGGVTGGTIAFIYSTEDWTNQNVRVELNANEDIKSDYDIEWKTDEFSIWTNYSTNSNIVLTKNGKVYVRLTDGINTTSDISKEVTWIDKLAPRAFTPNVSEMNANGLKVVGKTEDQDSSNNYGKSEVYKYYFYLYDGTKLLETGEVTVSNENESATYNFEKVEQGQTYTIKAVAEDKAGNKAEINDEYSITEDYFVSNVPSLKTDGAINFSYEPSEWTKDSVIAKAYLGDTVVNEGYALQYSKTGNKNDWHDYTEGKEVEYTKNGSFYVRLYDVAVGFGGASATANIENIDKLNPNDDFKFTILSKTTNSVEVEVSSTDAVRTDEYGCSGIDKYYFSINNGADWFPSLENGDETEGITLAKGKSSVIYNIENLNNNTEYTIMSKAVDKVGNERISSIAKSAKIKTEKIPEIVDTDGTDEEGNPIRKNIEISYNQSTKWAKTVTVTVDLLDTEIAKNYKLQYKTESMVDFDEYTAPFIVNRNGELRIRLTDEVSGGVEYIRNIDWIDSTAPEIQSFEVDGTPTKTSITVKGSAIDGESGIWRYQYSCDGGVTWRPSVEAGDSADGTVDGTYTFKNLEPGTSYSLQMKAIDNMKNEGYSGIIEQETDSVPVVNLDRDISYTFSNVDETGEQYWTNQNVTLTISIINNEKIDNDTYSLKYQIPGENPAYYNGKSITVTKCGYVYVWLEAGDGSEGKKVELPLVKIDKDVPEEFVPEVIESSTTSLTISVPAGYPKDKENIINEKNESSGIAYYQYSSDDGKTWHPSKAAGDETDGTTETNYKFTGLKENTNYTLTMRVFDNATNYADMKITATTRSILTITNNDINFEFSPELSTLVNGWTNEPVFVTVSVKEGIDTTGYTLQYNKDGEGWKDYTNRIRFDTIGDIQVRLIDNEESKSYGTATSNITCIDTTPPSVLSVTNVDRMYINYDANIGATFKDAGDTSDGKYISGLDGCFVSPSNNAPSKDDEGWIANTSGSFEIPVVPEDYGNLTYYIWIKDKAGNVSEPATCTVNVCKQDITGSWDGYVNSPSLMAGMTPVYWNDAGEEIELTNTHDYRDWYDYNNKKWANAVTKDASGNITGYWVWIPRFAYRIESGRYTSTAGAISIDFLKNTTDDSYTQTGIFHELTDWTSAKQPDYVVHPSFTDGTNNPSGAYVNGEWNKELSGFWVSKYEAGYQGNTITETKTEQPDGSIKVALSTRISNAVSVDNLVLSNQNYSVNGSNRIATGQMNSTSTKMSYPVFTPLTYIYNMIDADDMFNLSRTIEDGIEFYGLRSEQTDSHQIKNSEYGALVYLTWSTYGRNKAQPSANNYYNTSSAEEDNRYAITGLMKSSMNSQLSNAYAYDTSNGMRASSTGNISGVYGLNSPLGTITAATGKTSTGTSVSSLVTNSPYKSYVPCSDTEGNRYREAYSKKKKATYGFGDAILEVSKSGAKTIEGTQVLIYSNVLTSTNPEFTLKGGIMLLPVQTGMRGNYRYSMVQSGWGDSASLDPASNGRPCVRGGNCDVDISVSYAWSFDSRFKPAEVKITVPGGGLFSSGDLFSTDVQFYRSTNSTFITSPINTGGATLDGTEQASWSPGGNDSMVFRAVLCDK